MTSSLDYSAVVKHNDYVAVLYGRKSVSYYEYRSAFHKSVHTLLYECFGTRINGRGCLVEYHYGSVGYRGSRDRQKLFLSLRQVSSVTREQRVIALGQSCYEVVRICKLCCRNTLFVSSVQSAVTDIIHYRARKEIGILQYYSQRPSQITLLDFVDIDFVITDFAVGNIVETVDKIGNSCFTCTRSSYERNLLSGTCVYRYVVQNHLLLGISEVDFVEFDISRKSFVCNTAVCLMRMFPSPYTRTLFALYEFAVYFLGVYKSYISVIRLRLLVEKFEYSSRTRSSHYYRIEL